MNQASSGALMCALQLNHLNIHPEALLTPFGAKLHGHDVGGDPDPDHFPLKESKICAKKTFMIQQDDFTRLGLFYHHWSRNKTEASRTLVLNEDRQFHNTRISTCHFQQILGSKYVTLSNSTAIFQPWILQVDKLLGEQNLLLNRKSFLPCLDNFYK